MSTDTGYVHLPFAQLQDICLAHLISGMDEDGSAGPSDGATTTAITGYTEWVANGKVNITIGWDWQMLAGGKSVQLKRVSEPASNLMLQSASGVDLGPQGTTVLLENYIDDFNWQSDALQYIITRYRN